MEQAVVAADRPLEMAIEDLIATYGSKYRKGAASQRRVSFLKDRKGKDREQNDIRRKMEIAPRPDQRPLEPDGRVRPDQSG